MDRLHECATAFRRLLCPCLPTQLSQATPAHSPTQEFEKRELLLLAKLDAKTNECDDIQSKLADLDGQLESKRSEATSLAAARIAVIAEFEAFIRDKHPFVDPLTHIFHRCIWVEGGCGRFVGLLLIKFSCPNCKWPVGPGTSTLLHTSTTPHNRKIKRSRKPAASDVAGGMRDDDSGDDDDDDDLLDTADDDDGGDDDEVDEDDGTEVCPPGCEQTLYDRVCEMREQRLDEEDAAADVAKQAESIKKEREVLAKKARLTEQSLNAINQVCACLCGWGVTACLWLWCCGATARFRKAG